MSAIEELLEQTQVWRGPDGRTYYVGELDDDYLGNVIAYLSRHADELLARRRRRLEELGSATTPRHVRELETTDALAWLADRPLYRALLAEQRRRGAIDGEVVATDESTERRALRSRERAVEGRVARYRAEHDVVTELADGIVARPPEVPVERRLAELSLLLERYRDAIRRLGEL